VGVGVGIIIEAYRYLDNIKIEEVYSSGRYKHLDKKGWYDNLSSVYGKSAQKVIDNKEGSMTFIPNLDFRHLREEISRITKKRGLNKVS
jgi:glycerol-1-phosphate dehydrogenase [NAD(P)+]